MLKTFILTIKSEASVALKAIIEYAKRKAGKEPRHEPFMQIWRNKKCLVTMFK